MPLEDMPVLYAATRRKLSEANELLDREMNELVCLNSLAVFDADEVISILMRVKAKLVDD